MAAHVAEALLAAEMLAQLLDLALGLELARRLGDQRQQPLGREVVDELRLGRREANRRVGLERHEGHHRERYRPD